MANTVPVPNLPTISAEEIHANNLKAFRIGNRARYTLNQGIRALARGKGLLEVLECVTIEEYAEEYFDFKRSQTFDSIRVADALDSLPALSAAFQAGKISWSAVREITRLEKPDEEAWIAFAREHTSDEVRDSVRAARDNGRNSPRGGAGGLPRRRILISFSLDDEEYEIAKNSFAKTRGEMMARRGSEGSPDSKAIFLYQCRRTLETDPGNLPKDRIEKEGSIFTILYEVCSKCRTPSIHTDRGPVEVPIEHLEKIESEAKKVTIRPEEEVAGPPLKPPAIDPPNTPALTEKVLHRDGLVCAVPRCRRRVRLQADHIKERAKGGRTELANEHTLCDRHHSLKTAGLLKVERDQEGKVVYKRKADDLTAAILEEAEREVAGIPRVVVAESRRLDSGDGPEAPGGSGPAISEAPAGGGSGRAGRLVEVLEGLGHRKEQARRRIERAIEVLRQSGRKLTEGEVLRLACSWGYRQPKEA
jgi:hypothetical protein